MAKWFTSVQRLGEIDRKASSDCGTIGAFQFRIVVSKENSMVCRSGDGETSFSSRSQTGNQAILSMAIAAGGAAATEFLLRLLRILLYRGHLIGDRDSAIRRWFVGQTGEPQRTHAQQRMEQCFLAAVVTPAEHCLLDKEILCCVPSGNLDAATGLFRFPGGHQLLTSGGEKSRRDAKVRVRRFAELQGVAAVARGEITVCASQISTNVLV